MTTKSTLGRLQRVPLRDCWDREDTDFTPWLASEENIAVLGDAIGIELEVEQEEAAVGPFRADILCRDTATDNLVIIENQLERTDHSHLGQTITYAAGLDAVTIVWVAARFTEEHRAALDWLNRISGEAIQFFGVEIEVWRIGDSVPAPKFNLVAIPNDWSKSAKEAASRRGALTAGQKALIDYWTGFGDYIDSQEAKFKRPKPYHSNWMAWGLGRTGATLVTIANAKAIAVKVEFNNRDHPTWFHKAHAEREAIEAELGFALEWLERPNKKFCFVNIGLKIDTRSEEARPKAYEWMLEKMTAIDRVFRPVVASLDDSALDDAEVGE